ncbi:MAG: GHMP family kinase ATP-binding protein [Promethearchaeota archaeon]
MTRRIKVSAPGRVCLYGEHQDYLNLSVIPAAINMRCYIDGNINNSGKIKLNDKLFQKSIEISLNSKMEPFKMGKNDYIKAVCNVFIKNNKFKEIKQNIGFSGDLWNEVPLKSGLSSSAAFLVTFVKLIDEIFRFNMTEEQIGHFAYLAEYNEMGIPCGQMDQLISSVGNIFHMKCIEPPEIIKLKFKVPGLVVGNTLIPKSTNSVHSVRVKEVNDAINFLKTKLDFDINKTIFKNVESYLRNKNNIWLKRIRATLKNRDITAVAYKELKKDIPDMNFLGELLNKHQKYLRDDYEVSIPKIDYMLSKGMKAGALGGKLTGAGMGGSIILLAPDNQKEVAKALTKAGGHGYVVDIDEGVRVENIE